VFARKSKKIKKYENNVHYVHQVHELNIDTASNGELTSEHSELRNQKNIYEHDRERVIL
jgi:hypothetical protein